MQTEQQDQPWEYFIGRTGNLHDYPRKKSQWYDEPGKKWRRCLCDNLNGLRFLPDWKYRIRKEDVPI